MVGETKRLYVVLWDIQKMINFLKLRDLFMSKWCKTLSYDKNYDQQPIKSKGMCFPTAIVTQKILGGKIVKGRVGKQSHFWNILEDGTEVDFTSDQYGGDGIKPLRDIKIIDANHKPSKYNNRVLRLIREIEKELDNNEIYCKIMS